MLENVMSWLGIHLVFGQGLNQTLFVGYFDELNEGKFGTRPVFKAYSMC